MNDRKKKKKNMKDEIPERRLIDELIDLFILRLLVTETLSCPAINKEQYQYTIISVNHTECTSSLFFFLILPPNLRNKFPQFPPYHLLRNPNILIYLPIMNRKCKSNKIRQNRCCSFLCSNRWCSWRGW